MVAADGVAFIKGEQPVETSSGQKLFSFVVINILGPVSRVGLVLVDEPDLQSARLRNPPLDVAAIIAQLAPVAPRFAQAWHAAGRTT